MKFWSLMVAMAALFVAPLAYARDGAVEAPIYGMMNAFNKGDAATAKSMMTVAPTIVDNVAPFYWSGPAAFDTWLTDLGKAEKAAGKTGGVVWFGDPVDESVVGDQAYVVTPCRYKFKRGGKAMREAGFIAFVLTKGEGGWKIASWSWASPMASALK